MTLREICETLEVSRRAIQGYENAGLVKATGRNKYGHLLYDDKAKERIAKIRFYQQLGLSIADITSIIDAPNQVVRNVLEQQVQKLVKEQMKMTSRRKKVYEKQKENSNNYSNHWYRTGDYRWNRILYMLPYMECCNLYQTKNL